MKLNPTQLLDRETVLNAIRGAVSAAGNQRISLIKFIATTGVTRHRISAHFARWEEALQAAGFDFECKVKRVPADQLLADWGRVARKLNRLPTRNQYRIEGKYSFTTIERRYEGWHNIPDVFRPFADANPEWADILPMLPPPDAKKPTKPPGRPAGRWLTSRKKVLRAKKSLYGPPLDFCVLRHAPVNEQGVVFLFGMLSEKLGFIVESLRSAFPDCEAKRRITPDGWERVRIEFEYESRNFREHGHNPEACDLIVCWHHNWPDCPLEVIELSKEFYNRVANSQN